MTTINMNLMVEQLILTLFNDAVSTTSLTLRPKRLEGHHDWRGRGVFESTVTELVCID
jgi:hypothetical protein